MVESMTIDFGERRNVSILVKSVNNTPFEILNPSFRLTCGSEIEDSGRCSLKELSPLETVVTAYVTPMRNNTTYTLVYEYDINPEHYIHRVMIRTR